MNKLSAPHIDSRVEFTGRKYESPCLVSDELLRQTDRLFSICAELQPVYVSAEGSSKTIWLRIPRGTFDDYKVHQYAPFLSRKYWTAGRENRAHRAVDTSDWTSAYPDEYVWYKLRLFECADCRTVDLNGKTVISALSREHDWYMGSDYNAYELCELLSIAAAQSMELVRAGQYNSLIAADLPYRYRFGVIKAACVSAAASSFPKNDNAYIGIMPCFISSPDVTYPVRDADLGWLEYFMHVDDADIAAFGDKIDWRPEEKAELLPPSGQSVIGFSSDGLPVADEQHVANFPATANSLREKGAKR